MYENEVWKPVLGRETHYEVSDQGRVKRKFRLSLSGKKYRSYPPKILDLTDNHGLIRVHIKKIEKDQSENPLVSRLVLETFTGDVFPTIPIIYKDGNKYNVKLDNLRYPTGEELGLIDLKTLSKGVK
jgi:hypothetical protein